MNENERWRATASPLDVEKSKVADLESQLKRAEGDVERWVEHYQLEQSKKIELLEKWEKSVSQLFFIIFLLAGAVIWLSFSK